MPKRLDHPGLQIPTLIEAMKKAEKILGETLEGEVKVRGYHRPTQKLIREIISIDSAKFRKELQYNKKELLLRVTKPGFYCIMIYLEGKPIAFDYGYDEEKGVFFSDSAATMIERKGLGRFLSILELLYQYENGYQAVRFTTEELDQEGRPLREIWEKQGYRVVARYPDGGVDMMLEINPFTVAERAEKLLR